MTYAVEDDVVYLGGSPKEREFPLAQIQAIMVAQDKVVNDFLPKEYIPDEEGYATIVKFANYLAAVEVRKEWIDIGNKIPGYLKEIEAAKLSLEAGFPDDESIDDDGANFMYSDMPVVDYIYMSPYFHGGSRVGYV